MSIEIADMLGKVLLSWEFSQDSKENLLSIKVNWLTRGFYFLKANTNLKTETIKFLKN
jgi:hypothetical protein